MCTQLCLHTTELATAITGGKSALRGHLNTDGR